MLRSGILLVLMTGLVTPLAAQGHRHAAPPDSTSGGMMGMACPMMGGDGMDMGNMMGGTMEGGTMMGGGMMGGGMSGMMSMARLMMQGMRFAPARVLGLADSLGLTDAQVAAIRALASRAPDRATMHEQLRTRFEALQRALDANPVDTTTVTAAAEAAFAAHARWQARHVTTAAAVRAVLTAEQRDHLNALATCPMGGGQGGMSDHAQRPRKSS